MTAATSIKVTALNVGQGMGSLVEVLGANNVTLAVVLIDFGSSGNAYGQADVQCQTIHAAIARNRGVLTALVVSHKDKDHWNWLCKLRPSNSPNAPPAFYVATLWRGGSRWGGTEGLAELAIWAQKAGEQSSILFSATQSGFEANGGFAAAPLNLAANVQMSVVCTNVGSTNDANGDPNTTSAVVAIQFREANQLTRFSMIFPGDATVDSIRWINNHFGFTQQPPFNSPLGRCLLLSVPHHGADRTLADTLMDRSNRTFSAAKIFGDNIGTSYAFASAGLMYGHPYERIMRLVAPIVFGSDNNVQSSVPEHPYLWFTQRPLSQQVGTKRKSEHVVPADPQQPLLPNVPFEYLQVQDERAYYTTVIQEDPVLGGQIVFEITTHGTVTVTPPTLPPAPAAGVVRFTAKKLTVRTGSAS